MALTTSEFQSLALLFYNEGRGVTYYNNNSGLVFFGYPSVAEDEYLQGASFLKNLTVTIVQA